MDTILAAALLSMTGTLMMGCGAPQSGIGSKLGVCKVTDQYAYIDITIPVTIENRSGSTRMERIAWHIDCARHFPECVGTGIWVSRIERTGSAAGTDAIEVSGAEVISLIGLRAVVQWGQNTFIIDADSGTVTFRGPILGLDNAYGEARCDEYGEPTQGSTTGTTVRL
ncbi:hypothetical protein [Haliangium sp.]|uniref:hypothetical protein n=1 Tax=Haliangium sp. TaxID=2663208 RepID=UPI003D137FD1